MLLSGAELVLKCLKDYEVDSIFGFPGGAVIPIYDALYRDNLGIKHYRTCHEQGAVHAADGYARATGKVGVCLAALVAAAFFAGAALGAGAAFFAGALVAVAMVFCPIGS